MPQYLYKITPVRPEMLSDKPTPDEDRITGEHFEYLKQLTDEGIVILAGRTLNDDYSAFGIIIFTAEDDAAAQQIVHNDPAVAQRVMRAEWYPYRIALMKADNASE